MPNARDPRTGGAAEPGSRGGAAPLDRKARRRIALVSLLRSVVVTLVVFVLYFTLPFDRAHVFNTAAALLIGLAAVSVLIVWQAWAISRSPIPVLRAVEGLATSFPLVVLLFATAYFVMEQYQAHSFTQPMSRVDALYFTVTTLATVGYGDITPVAESARVTVMLQMVVDIVLIGLVARSFVASARTGLARRADLAR